VPTHIVELQGDRPLLRRHRPVKQPIVGHPVHPAWSCGERRGEIAAAAKAYPGLLWSANGAMARDLLLARIGQAAAMSAREERGRCRYSFATRLPQCCQQRNQGRAPPRWHRVDTSGTRCSTDFDPLSSAPPGLNIRITASVSVRTTTLPGNHAPTRLRRLAAPQREPWDLSSARSKIQPHGGPNVVEW